MAELESADQLGQLPTQLGSSRRRASVISTGTVNAGCAPTLGRADGARASGTGTTRSKQRRGSSADPAPRLNESGLGASGTSGEETGAVLVHINEDGLETEFPLQDITTIGRHGKNSIRLLSREVSKHHAMVKRQGRDQYVLYDLESSNGCTVNKRAVKQASLTNGDTVMFGPIKLKFYTSAPSASSSRAVRLMRETKSAQMTIHIALKPDAETEGQNFLPATEVKSDDILRRDYENLRFAYELSRLAGHGTKMDISDLLRKTLEVAFDVLPVDNGVVLLVDPQTGVASPHTIKQRVPVAQPGAGDGSGASGSRSAKTTISSSEILLSTTIINQVLREHNSLLISDAIADPRFNGAESITAHGLRSAIVAPLMANGKMYGVMHLDSHRVMAFSEKDLQLMTTLACQAALAIANKRLMTRAEQDEKSRQELARFLPNHVVEEMMTADMGGITKRGRQCNASVLFVDIRGFTTISEGYKDQPQEVVDLLNDYFERSVDAVFSSYGVLDKFIGDAVMAHWGTLVGDKEPEFNAVVAAIAIRDAIREMNAQRRREGREAIGVGVGVNTGLVIAGFVGSSRRLEYTVIGDAVNTASRLCGLADSDQVVISEATMLAVAGRIETVALGERNVKGKEIPVKIFEARRVIAPLAPAS